MAIETNAHHTGLAPGPSAAELAELARLGARFRGHRIFHEVTQQRGVRYVARSAAAGSRPHTVITDDLAELRNELEQAAPPELAEGTRIATDTSGARLADPELRRRRRARCEDRTSCAKDTTLRSLPVPGYAQIWCQIVASTRNCWRRWPLLARPRRPRLVSRRRAHMHALAERIGSVDDHAGDAFQLRELRP